MCRQVTCETCAKISWAGCGQHVDSVMANVPRSERCEGHEAPKTPGFFSRLFRR